MRKPSTTTLAAAVTIALFAHAAEAQTRGAANAGRATAGLNASAPAAATSAGTTSSNAASANAQGAQLVDQQGRVLTDANGNTQVVILNPRDLAGSVTSTPELDRATRKELNKAKLASRSNKQLLNTIAPRTNVDRTDQMADDPPSPALSTPDRSLPRY